MAKWRLLPCALLTYHDGGLGVNGLPVAVCAALTGGAQAGV